MYADVIENKVGSIRSWLADYFETRRDGIKVLERYLGVDDIVVFLESNKQHWHNDYAAYAFLFGCAYEADQYPSIRNVIYAWVDFGNKLQNNGGLDMSRGKKIVELFEDLNKHIKSKNGEIEMSRGNIYARNSYMAKVCIGCWLADYFETSIDEDGRRNYEDGVAVLEKYLGVDSLQKFLEDNRQQWHNDFAQYAFDELGSSYKLCPTVDDVTDAWIEFGEELQKEGV